MTGACPNTAAIWRLPGRGWLAALLLLATACASSTPADGPRPASWAVPLAAHAGLPNLHRVSATLYRSAQPLPQGMAFLDTQPRLFQGDLPIRTVISLRAFNEDGPLMPPQTRLRLEQIRFKTWHPEHEDVVKFLRIATTPALQPVLVHCLHGSDRTGTMVAIYRIAVQGWTKAQAIDEMTHGGFGFHPIWQNLIRFIEALDVPALQAEVRRLGPWREPAPRRAPA